MTGQKALTEADKERVFKLVREGLPTAWIADDTNMSEYRVLSVVRGTPEQAMLRQNGREFQKEWAGILKSAVLLKQHHLFVSKRIDKGVRR